MSENTSTKPYMIRALHEWCTDNGFTPHLLVAVDGQTRVPMAYVKNGEIVLNLGYAATKNLLISNEAITFSARFGGISTNLYIPLAAVRGIFARENSQGMFFPEESAVPISNTGGLVLVAGEGEAEILKSDTSAAAKEISEKTSVKKPTLTLVK
ncbi:MAG: ClpXP protease specificity-enhancing factor [Methylophilaceae bacterium]|nr:ClpXP protease specificity-enhancing factor [Methylophilaceae bacterium]